MDRIGFDDAIALALALDRMPGRLIVHAIEAADLTQGPGLTPAVDMAVGVVVAAILDDIGADRRLSAGWPAVRAERPPFPGPQPVADARSRGPASVADSATRPPRPPVVIPTNKVTVALPFSKITIEEPGRELAELAAIVAELASFVEAARLSQRRRSCDCAQALATRVR